jgi:hypothetical protein
LVLVLVLVLVRVWVLVLVGAGWVLLCCCCCCCCCWLRVLAACTVPILFLSFLPLVQLQGASGMWPHPTLYSPHHWSESRAY